MASEPQLLSLNAQLTTFVAGVQPPDLLGRIIAPPSPAQSAATPGPTKEVVGLAQRQRVASLADELGERLLKKSLTPEDLERLTELRKDPLMQLQEIGD